MKYPQIQIPFNLQNTGASYKKIRPSSFLIHRATALAAFIAAVFGSH
jgi:hypothetical protein